MSSHHQIEWIPASFLKPHEALKERKASNFLRFARRTKGLRTKPILIDRPTGVILDGHHRFWICANLGCTRIPCIAVDYLHDPSIRVLPRRKDLSVSKEEVIHMGLSAITYPPKTTKHVYAIPEMGRQVRLTTFLPAQRESQRSPRKQRQHVHRKRGK